MSGAGGRWWGTQGTALPLLPGMWSPGFTECCTHLTLQDNVEVFPLVAFMNNDVTRLESALWGRERRAVGHQRGRQGSRRASGRQAAPPHSVPDLPSQACRQLPPDLHGMQPLWDVSRAPVLRRPFLGAHPPPPWHPAACRGGCRRGPAASAPCRGEGPAGLHGLPAPCLCPACTLPDSCSLESSPSR